jgi:pyruvate/2-oxoglutarate dehydrogenase complex dihydrolipoamide acyltransferase (E2) component
MTQVAVVPDTALLGGCERLVVSPAHGRVTISASGSYTTEGEVVRGGDVLASIDSDGSVIEVCAPCDAWLMDYLARDGQRVEPGTPIVHLRKV